ncbi:hypothetical protein HDU83_008622 [Entophlyctis luteolus]|nr:hypothetical protein HDU83_008622 [Entophlyctis luteolus]
MAEVELAPGGALRKRVLREGAGDLVAPMSLVSVHYTGYFHPNGAKFDSSHDRERPLEFKVGEGRVIRGWDDGLLSMRVGEVCELVCAPEFAYGEDGNPPTIPANATLLFQIEVLSCKPPEDPISKKVADAAAAKDEGNAHFAAKRFAPAAQAYRHGISRLEYSWGAVPAEMEQIGKLRVSLNLNLAASLIATKDMREAITACDRVLEVDARNVKALYRKGKAYVGLSKFADAENAFKLALEVAPEDAAILNELASLEGRQKELEAKEKNMYKAMFK